MTLHLPFPTVVTAAESLYEKQHKACITNLEGHRDTNLSCMRPGEQIQNHVDPQVCCSCGSNAVRAGDSTVKGRCPESQVGKRDAPGAG